MIISKILSTVLEKRRKPRSVPLHATGEPQNQPGFKSLQLLHYQSSIDVCLVFRIFTMANLKRAELSEAFDSAFAPGSTLDGQHVLPRVRLGVWIGKWLENVI